MSDTPEPAGEPPHGTSVADVERRPGASPPVREPGRPAARAAAAARPTAQTRIGIRELRQHASVYVDLAEKGYTVDITNRGRLVAQLVPAGAPGSPLERLIAAGILEPAEEGGGLADIDPYPAATEAPGGGPAASEVLARHRQAAGP